MFYENANEEKTHGNDKRNGDDLIYKEDAPGHRRTMVSAMPIGSLVDRTSRVTFARYHETS